MSSLKKNFQISILKLALKIHSLSYSLASILAIKIENDGNHPKHRIMNYHQFFIDNITHNDNVLDIGCGNGFLTYDIAKKAKSVVGIDIKEKNILNAEKNYSRSNLKFIHGDATKYLPKNKFDVVILSNVLEHIKNRVDFLISLNKLAKKLLIRVPMINRSWIDIYKKEIGVEYRLDKSHYTEYTFIDFKTELNRAGLEISDYSVQFGELWAIAFFKSK